MSRRTTRQIQALARVFAEDFGRVYRENYRPLAMDHPSARRMLIVQIAEEFHRSGLAPLAVNIEMLRAVFEAFRHRINYSENAIRQGMERLPRDWRTFVKSLVHHARVEIGKALAARSTAAFANTVWHQMIYGGSFNTTMHLDSLTIVTGAKK